MSEYSMRGGKENKERGKAKLSINVILPPPSLHTQQQQPPQRLHEEYEILQSGGSNKGERRVEGTPSEGRMKLRDYLFLAQTSASKKEGKKRVLGSANCNGGSSPGSVGMKRSKAELRKNKYCIDNGEMFHILKQEMERELADSLAQIASLRHSLAQLQEHSLPSNEQMVMMYSLRSLAKDKLAASIHQMKQLLTEGQAEHQSEKVEIEIDLSEGEFDREFKLASDFGPQHYFRSSPKRI